MLLLQHPELVALLGQLYQMMDSRVAVFGRLSRLQGKLDLMLSQVQYARARTRTRTHTHTHTHTRTHIYTQCTRTQATHARTHARTHTHTHTHARIHPVHTHAQAVPSSGVNVSLLLSVDHTARPGRGRHGRCPDAYVSLSRW